MKTRSVALTDLELLTLDGKCRTETQALVDAARARLESVDRYDGMDPRHAAFIADVLTEARRGFIVWRGDRIRSCSLCDAKPYGHILFKSGPRKGLPNHAKPMMYYGIELASRFVRFENRITLGGCTDCVDSLAGVLADALHDVRCQLPERLTREGRTAWKKYDNRHCTACGWDGHSGEMGQDRTILGDGWYPAFCPECGETTGGLFGKPTIVSRDGWVVDPPLVFAHAQRFGKWGNWPLETEGTR